MLTACGDAAQSGRAATQARYSAIRNPTPPSPHAACMHTLSYLGGLHKGVGGRQLLPAHGLVVKCALVRLRIAVRPAEVVPAAALEPSQACLLPACEAPVVTGKGWQAHQGVKGLQGLPGGCVKAKGAAGLPPALRNSCPPDTSGCSGVSTAGEAEPPQQPSYTAGRQEALPCARAPCGARLRRQGSCCGGGAVRGPCSLRC
jgi:hypothetical protein